LHILFFSYSHQDEALRDQLEVHLSMLRRQGLIEAWHDRRITAGEDFHGEISAHLEEADVILLLVSPDFIASDYCYEREMTRAMERHATGEATVIPVILRPCAWHEAPFGSLMATPKDGKPITLWPNSDEAFLDVTNAIKAALKKRGAVPKSSGPSSPRIASQGTTSQSGPRSSNLRVAKPFTEHDRDQFLHDAFEYIAKFFENSLEELSRRNPGIEGTIRRIDANRFTAAAYRDGKAVARCGVRLGGAGHFSGNIAYSTGDAPETNSYNESLSVDADDQTLFFKSLGLSDFGRNGEREKLSTQGAAELLWGLFIAPLQQT